MSCLRRKLLFPSDPSSFSPLSCATLPSPSHSLHNLAASPPRFCVEAPFVSLCIFCSSHLPRAKARLCRPLESSRQPIASLSSELPPHWGRGRPLLYPSLLLLAAAPPRTARLSFVAAPADSCPPGLCLLLWVSWLRRGSSWIGVIRSDLVVDGQPRCGPA